MKAILTFLQKRLTEHTSWYGLMLIALSFGLKITPEQQQAIIYFGMAMAGAPDVNLAKVLQGMIGKNAVTAEPTTIKESVKNDKNKTINSVLNDDADL